jgi:anti-sigma B factor antagonist
LLLASHTRRVGLLHPVVVTMPEQFGFSVAVDGAWGVLVAGGELDLAADSALRAHLRELVDGGVRHVIVDLRQVSFMDSTGLGVLVAANRQLGDGEPARSLRLVCTNERTVKVFRLTGLLPRFPMHASVEQARAADDQHPVDPVGGASG